MEACTCSVVVTLVKVKNSSPPPTVGRLSADCRPTDNQQFTGRLPIVGCWPTVSGGELQRYINVYIYIFNICKWLDVLVFSDKDDKS